MTAAMLDFRFSCNGFFYSFSGMVRTLPETDDTFSNRFLSMRLLLRGNSRHRHLGRYHTFLAQVVGSYLLYKPRGIRCCVSVRRAKSSPYVWPPNRH